jgi:hypothetical protein
MDSVRTDSMTSASVLWLHGQTGSISRRQQAVSHDGAASITLPMWD